MCTKKKKIDGSMDGLCFVNESFETRTEEILSNGSASSEWRQRGNGDVKLRDEDQDNEDHTEPRSISTTEGLEWQFFNTVSLCLPSSTESDARKKTG